MTGISGCTRWFRRYVKKNVNYIFLFLSFPPYSMACTSKQVFVNTSWLRLILGRMMSSNLVTVNIFCLFIPKDKRKICFSNFHIRMSSTCCVCEAHIALLDVNGWQIPSAQRNCTQTKKAASFKFTFFFLESFTFNSQWVKRPCHNTKGHTRSKFSYRIFWDLCCNYSIVQIAPLPTPALIAFFIAVP